MKYVKILFAIALVFTLCSAFSIKKGSHKPVYAFGVSASFTDVVKGDFERVFFYFSASLFCLLFILLT